MATFVPTCIGLYLQSSKVSSTHMLVDVSYYRWLFLLAGLLHDGTESEMFLRLCHSSVVAQMRRWGEENLPHLLALADSFSNFDNNMPQ